MSKYSLLPDWAPHCCCWMSWAVDPKEWGRRTPQVRKELKAVVQTVAQFEPVKLLTPPHLLTDARHQDFGCDVEIIPAPVDDISMRDIAPIYAFDRDELICVDLNFNGWGSTEGRNARPGDRLARLGRHLFPEKMISAPFIAEGGSIVVDGHGTAFTTKSCLLNPNRNPFLEQSEIDAALRALGATDVAWLDGDPDEPITSGHIDGYVLPTEAGGILIQEATDYLDLSILRNRDRDSLIAYTKNLGPKAHVRTVKPPRLTRTTKYFADSYVNVYVANSAVIAPRFGDSDRDALFMATLRECFPNHKALGLDIKNIASGGGGIRCLIQPVPRRPSA